MQPRIITTSAVGAFLIIAVIPVLLMLVGSLRLDDQLSFQNYVNIFSSSRPVGLFFRSIGLASISTLLSLLIGVPFAFMLTGSSSKSCRLWKWLFLLPLFIPPYVHAATWIYLCGEQGVINQFLIDSVGLQRPLINIYGLFGSAFILALAYYPFVVLLTSSGLFSIDKRQEDAAATTHSPSAVLRKITLPLIAPYILSSGVFVFIFSLFNYGVPALLRVHTYPVEIFAQFSAFYNEGGATAQSVPIILIAIILLYGQWRYMGERSYVTFSTGSYVRIQTLFSPKPGILSTAGIWAMLFLSVFLPLVVMAIQAKTIESFQVAFRTSQSELLTSLSLSLVASTVIVLLSYLLSTAIEDNKLKFRKWLDGLTFLPFAFPATLLGVGLIYTWNRPQVEYVYTTSVILIIAYIARFTPFAIRILNSAIKQVGPSLKEAAFLYEKRWWRRVICIELPLLKQGIKAAWIIAFILCMGELGSTLLVIPPGNGTLSLKIFTLMHYGSNKLVAALALILIGINVLVAFSVTFLSRSRLIFWR